MNSYLPRWSFIHNIVSAAVGRIIIAWDPSVFTSTSVLSSSQHILCRACHPVLSTFYLSCVYGYNDVQGRQELWKPLVDNKVENEPRIIAGDFNPVRSRAQSNYVPDATLAAEFNDCVDRIDVIELAGHGCVFTWCANWSTGECCLRKLDHTFYHYALSIHVEQEVVEGPRPFRYNTFWQSHLAYKDTVSEAWSQRVEGSRLEVLLEKFKSVKVGMSQLNKLAFSDIEGRV
ncbi:hypothetical protein LIER_17455 [Lithospermum erythrorhizon]|uniref:Endonuclease/exonuclease/phosphatase domain-containing protein n=1 Tax=Lithospermum erythrorhizon TaxID=34254 RepID=A0AAV3QDM6_LITER